MVGIDAPTTAHPALGDGAELLQAHHLHDVGLAHTVPLVPAVDHQLEAFLAQFFCQRLHHVA